MNLRFYEKWLADLRHELDLRDMKRAAVEDVLAQQDRDREAAFQDEMRRG